MSPEPLFLSGCAYDIPDYVGLHLDWLQRDQEQYGTIVCHGLTTGETVRRLPNLPNRMTADEMWNQIGWLHAFK